MDILFDDYTIANIENTSSSSSSSVTHTTSSQAPPTSSANDNTSAWSLASGMFNQLKTNVGDFVSSVNVENAELVQNLKDKSSAAVSNVQTTLSKTLVSENTLENSDENANAENTVLNEDNVGLSLPTGVSESIERLGAQVESLPFLSVAPSVKEASSKVWTSALSLFGTNANNSSVFSAPLTTSTPSSTLPAGAALEQRLKILRANINTYTKDPSDDENTSGTEIVSRFTEFKSSFVLEGEYRRRNEILLQEDTLVATFYSEIVPTRASEFDFWVRYWFGELELVRSDQLRSGMGLRKPNENIELSWGDDDDDDDNNDEKADDDDVDDDDDDKVDKADNDNNDDDDDDDKTDDGNDDDETERSDDAVNKSCDKTIVVSSSSSDSINNEGDNIVNDKIDNIKEQKINSTLPCNVNEASFEATTNNSVTTLDGTNSSVCVNTSEEQLSEVFTVNQSDENNTAEEEKISDTDDWDSWE